MRILRRIYLLGALCIIIFTVKLLTIRLNIYDSYPIELQKVISFSEKSSFIEGEELTMKVHCESDCYGQLYSLGEEMELVKDSIFIKKCIQSNIYSPKIGLAWKTNARINSNDLKSGYYLLKLSLVADPDEYYFHPLLISPKNPVKIAVISSTNTWQAYNSYGGKSNYQDDILPKYYQRLIKYIPQLKPIIFCPDQRPYSFMIEDFNNEILTSKRMNNSGLITEVDTFGIAEKPIVSYDTIASYFQHVKGEWCLLSFLDQEGIDYGVYSNQEFAYNNEILNAELIIFHMHSEYWSQEMIGRLESYYKKGGHVIFASGNNIYREVEFYEKGIIVKDDIDNQKIRDLTGTSYSDVSYPLISPYKVENADHWVFSECRLKNGDLFSNDGSGWETDKIGMGSGDFSVLAIGNNKVGPAYMGIKEFKNGGWIFNASSMTFTQSITKDLVVKKLMMNLINNAIGVSKKDSIY